MVEQMIWSLMVKAGKGPTLSASGTLDVEAYDKLTVSVAAGTSQVVELGPGTSGSIRCLMINPSLPDALLTYDVDGTGVALDEPQLLLGGGVGLAGNPTSLRLNSRTRQVSSRRCRCGSAPDC